jgi:hypothetical protein
MKKLFAFLLFIPFCGITQEKNVINSQRLFPKIDKVAEFEKALTTHAQKYHTGDWKWRVFEIQSGPDFGGYQITEGPSTWEQVDSRGDLGKEHMNDWNKNVTIYLTDKASSSYGLFREDLSTIQLTDYTNKIAITHIYPATGYGDKVEELLKKAKKAWALGNQTVAVYEGSSSGPAQFSLVYRYKQGLKERNKDFRKPMKERFNTANGEDSFDAYLDGIRKYVDKAWSELLFFREDLSSK